MRQFAARALLASTVGLLGGAAYSEYTSQSVSRLIRPRPKSTPLAAAPAGSEGSDGLPPIPAAAPDGFIDINDSYIANRTLPRILMLPAHQRQVILVTDKTLSPAAVSSSRAALSSSFACGASATCVHIGPSAPESLARVKDWYRLPDFPAQAVFASEYDEKEEKYVLPFGPKSVGSGPMELSPSKVSEWAGAISSGSLKPYKTSARRPPGDREPGTKNLWRVVYDSFNDVVLDPKADVLVEVYMPGCKACGALSPRVHMLSDLLAAQGIKGVKLALMDTDANDIPRLHIPERGYPILKLFPAADKLKPTTVPMLGDGGRSGLPTIPELLAFLSESGTNKFTVTEAMTEAAAKLEAHAKFLEKSKHRLSNLAHVFFAYKQAGHEGAGIAKDVYAKATSDIREALIGLHDLLDSAFEPSAQEKILSAFAAVEELCVKSNAFAVTLGKNAVWIRSADEYFKVVGYALSGPEGVVVAFGNSGLDTWSTDAAGLLRKLGDEKEPGVKIYHVDCLALGEVCTASDASASSPSVHFYRGGTFVSKVFWENTDLLEANARAIALKPKQ